MFAYCPVPAPGESSYLLSRQHRPSSGPGNTSSCASQALFLANGTSPATRKEQGYDSQTAPVLPSRETMRLFLPLPDSIDFVLVTCI